jgi:hypothetical protein
VRPANPGSQAQTALHCEDDIAQEESVFPLLLSAKTHMPRLEHALGHSFAGVKHCLEVILQSSNAPQSTSAVHDGDAVEALLPAPEEEPALGMHKELCGPDSPT